MNSPSATELSSTQSAPLEVLVVEDEQDLAETVLETLEVASKGAIHAVWARNLGNGLKHLSEHPVSLVLLDLNLPDSEGLNGLALICRQNPDVPVVVLTSQNDEQLGLEAVHSGAQDYLVKGTVDALLLVRSIRYAVERNRLLAEIRRLSLVDQLTGVYNRRGFITIAEQQLRLARRMKKSVALLFIDIDNMKKINDGLGHKQGDVAIHDAARLLRASCRETDIIGRIGGDEFVAQLISNNGPVGTDTVLERLRTKLYEHNKEQKRPFLLELSMGVARYNPEYPCSMEDLMLQADSLMYEQKRARKQKEQSKKEPSIQDMLA